MTEVLTSSLCERPCAGIEDTLEASIGTGGRGEQRYRKVHSLIDKVYDRSNLTEAWKHVRENKGSAGIDGLTIAAFTEREDELLARLHEQLRDRSYRPRAVKRVAIPKAGGGTRNLGIPSVIDRVVQQALVAKMTPIFEPLFADCSFGYRPGRSPHMAMRKVWREINEGNLWILDADLRSYFDKIDQERLVDLIAEEISDGRVLQLIRSFLEAGVIVEGAWEPTKTGVPQGGVASPLWSNIYLTPFDHAMTKAGYRLTRWADDFVVVCRTRQEAEAALATARAFLHEKLGVSLHPEKTRIVHVTNGFEFLGYKIGKGKGLKLPAHKRTARTNPLVSTPYRGKNRWTGSRIKSET
jgi:RNA-directed DNA polymerase